MTDKEESLVDDVAQVRDRTGSLMPEILEELEHLVAIPSVAFPGYPAEPVVQMGEEVLRLFEQAGIPSASLHDVPEGYRPIYGSVDGPPGSPIVMMYAHYDVQPAPAEQGWTSDPWTATRKDDGRIYGRGAADDKGGLAVHLGTLRYFDGAPPCSVKLIVEGMEETNSNLEEFVRSHPDLFACDLFIVCDMGNLSVGAPTLTTTLRGEVSCVVTVRTLEHPLHSGVFGGPTPDAMIVLARLLATLHDDAGDVAVEGVSSFDWEGMDFSEQDLRGGADMVDGVDVIGSGSVGSRLWSHPSVSAIGIDTTSIDGSSNVLLPVARAKLSMRIVPGSDPTKELDALVAHLKTHAPWGVSVEIERAKEAPPFACETGGPGYAAARVAMEDAFGSAPGLAGSGGSIPLLRTLQEAAPEAEFILWGPEDVAKSRIHASDESVDPTEIEDMIVAQIRLLQHLADPART